MSVRTPYVCLSVTRRYSVETAEHIIKLFHLRVATPFWVLQYRMLSDGDPLTGAANAEGA